MKPIFGRGPALALRLFLAVVLSFALIIADTRFQAFNPIRTYLYSMVSPIHYLAAAPGLLLNQVASLVQRQNTLINKNKAQGEKIFLLETQLLLLNHLQEENERLRKLLGSPLPKEEHKMVAELLSVDDDPFSHHILINKGSSDGVFEGQPVFSDAGVIGQVLFSGHTTSRIILITDQNHALPVRVQRNELRAIAHGTGDIDRLTLENLPKNTDIVVGDLLFTSGLGGRFPEGYPVGIVTAVSQPDSSPFIHVEARPMAALDRLRYLLLLWSEAKPDLGASHALSR